MKESPSSVRYRRRQWRSEDGHLGVTRLPLIQMVIGCFLCCNTGSNFGIISIYFIYCSKAYKYQQNRIHESKNCLRIYCIIFIWFLKSCNVLQCSYFMQSFLIVCFWKTFMELNGCMLFTVCLGLPIYRGGFPTHNSLDNLLNPRASLPPSAVTRDPFWYDLGDLSGLRPFRASSYLPPSLRDSYLSPIKRRYLWTRHPIRPFGKHFYPNFCGSNYL